MMSQKASSNSWCPVDLASFRGVVVVLATFSLVPLGCAASSGLVLELVLDEEDIEGGLASCSLRW